MSSSREAARELYEALDSLLMAFADYSRWTGIADLTKGQATMFCEALNNATAARERNRDSHGTPRFHPPSPTA